MKHITVVDSNPVIGELLTEATNWFRPGPTLTFEIADAKTYYPKSPVDVLLVDIWPQLGDLDAEFDTRTIQSHVSAQAVAWWGQELDWISFMHDNHRRLPPTIRDAQDYQTYLGFKVLGMDHFIYPQLAYRAGVGFALGYGKAVQSGSPTES